MSRAWPLLAVVVATALPACGGGSRGSSGCSAPHQDRLDIRSTIHVLPGAPDPPFLTNPPTSGAHRVGYYPRGVVASPIARPTQVALLEKGFVVVQYRPALGPSAAAALATLTALSPYVTVAPSPTLPDPVVATSWLHDVRCSSADDVALGDLRRFITQRVGQGVEPTIPLSATSPGGLTTTTRAG